MVKSGVYIKLPPSRSKSNGVFGVETAIFAFLRVRHWQQSRFRVSYGMLRSVLVKTVITTLVCLLAGIIVYGFGVFEIHRPTFQFISTGILGSLFFFTMREAGIRHAVLVLFFFFIVMTGFLTEGYRHGLLLRDAVYVAAVGIALFLYSTRIHRRDQRRQWLFPIILGALLGAVMLLATLFLALITPQVREMHAPGLLPRIWPVAAMNFVVGIGLGTGIAVCDYIPTGGRRH